VVDEAALEFDAVAAVVVEAVAPFKACKYSFSDSCSSSCFLFLFLNKNEE
jgi:hypothetical protein